MATYDHFYDLPVYKICRAFRKKISEVANKFFPKKEDYLLKSQLLDAARSITANIADGFGRFHHQENIQFCRMARGSLTETMDHMITAFDDSYITEEYLKELNTYIKYLKTAKITAANN